mmetsp:Transcript_109549/g.172740  ORF Transcript_109549/g.172740 Transcript_109549/m.172740 type:complete len:86 (+) Transcript_109549:544-801(+)
MRPNSLSTEVAKSQFKAMSKLSARRRDTCSFCVRNSMSASKNYLDNFHISLLCLSCSLSCISMGGWPCSDDRYAFPCMMLVSCFS